MNIDEILNQYRKEDSGHLIAYIQDIVEQKAREGEWDKGIDENSQNLTTMLLYEYATSIEKLTEGKMKSKDVIDKLAKQMGKLRFGDFRKGIDDIVKYDDMSVTSDEYQKKCRVDSKFGAHAVTYQEASGEEKKAIVLFDDKQKAMVEGKEKTLAGIDLSNLADMRGTIFHEWTHVMAHCQVKASTLKREDILFENGDSTFIHTSLSPMLSRKEYKDYIQNVDSLLQSDAMVSFSGISTIEINDKSRQDRIMHNKIDEGATEFIARKVLETVGEKVVDPSRYRRQVDLMGSVFQGRGLADSITTYFTKPYEYTRELENQRVREMDMLHYMSSYIISQDNHKPFERFRIDKNGNVVQSSFFSRVSDKIKRIFSKKSQKTLPQSSINHKTEEEEKMEFIENLKEKNGTNSRDRNSQNYQTRRDTKKSKDQEKPIEPS